MTRRYARLTALLLVLTPGVLAQEDETDLPDPPPCKP